MAGSIITSLYAETLNSQQKWSEWSELVALVVGLIVALGMVWLVVSAYEKRRRPGAKRTFWFVLKLLGLASLALIFAHSFFPQSHEFQAMSILLRFVELTLWALLLAWALFWLAFVGASVTGSRAVKQTAAAHREDQG